MEALFGQSPRDTEGGEVDATVPSRRRPSTIRISEIKSDAGHGKNSRQDAHGRRARRPRAGTMVWRDHNVDIQNRSILIVESNEKAIVRTQGQITDMYGPGSTNLNSPNSGVYSAFKRLNYGGNVPWLCEALFFSMARFEAKSAGVSQSSELIPIQFQVAYYFQIDDPKLLLQAVQLSGDRYTVDHLAVYMSPIIDQAVSTVVNKVKVEEIV